MRKLLLALFSIAAIGISLSSIGCFKDDDNTSTISAWELKTNVWKCTQERFDFDGCSIVGEYITQTYPKPVSVSSDENCTKTLYLNLYKTLNNGVYAEYTGSSTISECSGNTTRSLSDVTYHCTDNDRQFAQTDSGYKLDDIDWPVIMNIDGDTMTIRSSSDSNEIAVYTKAEIIPVEKCIVPEKKHFKNHSGEI